MGPRASRRIDFEATRADYVTLPLLAHRKTRSQCTSWHTQHGLVHYPLGQNNKPCQSFPRTLVFRGSNLAIQCLGFNYRFLTLTRERSGVFIVHKPNREFVGGYFMQTEHLGLSFLAVNLARSIDLKVRPEAPARRSMSASSEA